MKEANGRTEPNGPVAATLAVLVLCAGCGLEDDGGADAGAGGSGTGGVTSGGEGGGPEGGTPGVGGGEPGAAGGAPTCELVNIVPSPGLDACFDCMAQACCEALQICDGDERCLACMADPVNNADACTEQTPEAFETYGPFADLAACQSSFCVPPCGVSGETACTRDDCPPSCAGYANGCLP
jgi:hypothetical protein